MHPTLTSTCPSKTAIHRGVSRSCRRTHCLDVKPAPTVAAPEAGPVIYLSIPIVIAVIVMLTTHVMVVMIALVITIATIVASMT